MSHQRYPSIDPVKEPHAVNLKVLRLSRPSLVTQQPLTAPDGLPSTAETPATTYIPASLAYQSTAGTNADPFFLSPILNLPPSFGSAYVGETFSCTLCANYDPPDQPPTSPVLGLSSQKQKSIRDVRIEAEMKTPGSATVQKLALGPQSAGEGEAGKADGKDLEPGQTLQQIVNFDLKEEGNHVLAVTVSYYEATETSGRTRTFRKLYQFICKGSLIVRTKVGPLPPAAKKAVGKSQPPESPGVAHRRWIMEAQLENCSEDVMQLQRVVLDLETGLRYRDANWKVSGSAKPVLHPGEIEQVCFVVEEDGKGVMAEEADGRVVFGVLGIGWRTEMGNRGYLSTGKLGSRALR